MQSRGFQCQEETGVTFEKEAIPIGEAKWNVRKKKSIPKKAAAAVKTAGVNKLHSKVYEVALKLSLPHMGAARSFL